MDKTILTTGIALGIGLKWLSPFVVPALASGLGPLTRIDLKPAAKTAVKLSWLGMERSREWLSHLGETLEDAVAEARAELIEQGKLNEPVEQEKTVPVEDHS